MDQSRETGIVKDWRNKGFGFIDRDEGGSVFCHARETPDRQGLTKGSKVSFLYEYDDKGGKALQVTIDEAAPENTATREMGIVKRWNAEKGFGFIGRTEGGDDAFFHKRDTNNKDFAVGQAVSFVIQAGPKGASAKHIMEEESGETIPVEEEGEREYGKVKSFNEEKGFAFIGRCSGGDDLFSHKKEFGSLTPYPGQPVSFIVETTEKGDAAKKVREEDNVPELATSDAGREFGTIKDFIQDKGYGFVIRRAGGENARFFEKACNGMVPTKGITVSFVCEDTEKGPTAKDLRQEDPARVERITAKVHYGRVESYWDPTTANPTNGYGFIVPFAAPTYGAPKKYYFHMDELENPDEDGGIEPNTNVSFIVIPAKKGVQAASVTVAEPPPPETDNDKENEPALVQSFGDFGLGGGEEDGFGTAGKEATGGKLPAVEENAAWDF